MAMREGIRSAAEASCNGIVRRMVSLPRSLMGGFSRAMGHGRHLIGIGSGRRTQTLPSNFPMHYPEEPLILPEVSVSFLIRFEQQYGTTHPFFYACRFMEALKIAEDEHKFLFLYLHSPEHPFTPSFCRETLSSEAVVQFLDANFVSWGAIADRDEGLQMSATLRPACFPFCAVIAPVAGDNIAVMQQMEGPISPTELVGILQRTLEEQGLAFRSLKAKNAEKIIADRRLREEQDAAYLADIQIDKEKERLKNVPPPVRPQKPAEAPNKANHERLQNHSAQKQHGKTREASIDPQDPQAARILIRFPNGERREQCFLCTDKLQAVYRYIDSLGVHQEDSKMPMRKCLDVGIVCLDSKSVLCRRKATPSSEEGNATDNCPLGSRHCGRSWPENSLEATGVRRKLARRPTRRGLAGNRLERGGARRKTEKCLPRWFLRGLTSKTPPWG